MRNAALKNQCTGRRLLNRMLMGLSLLCIAPSAWAQTCPAGYGPLNWDSPQGSRWEMCWSHEARSGVVLRNIVYIDGNGNRRMVLREASVAQLFIAYDDGSSRVDYVSSGGLGGNRLRRLNVRDCFGNEATVHTLANRSAVCTREVDRGHLFRWYSLQGQGSLFEVFSVSDIGPHSFISRWRFYENGTIEPAIGHGGRIWRYGPSSVYTERVGRGFATAWTTNAFWRLNMDIGDRGNDAVREFNIRRHGTENARMRRDEVALNQEVGRSLAPAVMRTWQIYDTVATNDEGMSISYELMPQQGGVSHKAAADPWSRWDLYVTRFRNCERYVVNNNLPGCAGSLMNFLTGESTQSSDVVLWYRISRHHLPRDEDLPFRSLKWDSFQLVPRDWNGQSPLSWHEPTDVDVAGGLA